MSERVPCPYSLGFQDADYRSARHVAPSKPNNILPCAPASEPYSDMSMSYHARTRARNTRACVYPRSAPCSYVHREWYTLSYYCASWGERRRMGKGERRRREKNNNSGTLFDWDGRRVAPVFGLVIRIDYSPILSLSVIFLLRSQPALAFCLYPLCQGSKQVVSRVPPSRRLFPSSTTRRRDGPRPSFHRSAASGWAHGSAQTSYLPTHLFHLQTAMMVTTVVADG